MSILTVKDSTLAGELSMLERDINSLKTQQVYGMAQIRTENTSSITVGAYNVVVPGFVSGWGIDVTIGEVAATFMFKGANQSKTAVGKIIATISNAGGNDSPQARQLFFLPTDSPSNLRVACLWRLDAYSGARITVTLATNMPGSFELERTYQVYMS